MEMAPKSQNQEEAQEVGWGQGGLGAVITSKLGFKAPA